MDSINVVAPYVSLVVSLVAAGVAFWNSPPALAARMTQLELKTEDNIETVQNFIQRERARAARTAKAEQAEMLTPQPAANPLSVRKAAIRARAAMLRQ